MGRSRGGLLIGSWAIANPDKIAGLAGIYPVFDLRSYPGVNRAAPAFGLKPEELTHQLDKFNPVGRLNVLAEAKVPIFLIHGDEDKVVPVEANSQSLLREYDRAGSKDLATLIVAKGQGHNFWPGFFRNEKLVEFVVRTAKAGTKPKQ